MSIIKAQYARAEAHLSRHVRHDGVYKPARQMVEELVAEGRTARVKTYEWKGKERTAYVLEDEVEGTFYELSKTQYNYALTLISERGVEAPLPSPKDTLLPVVPCVTDIGKEVTVWPHIVDTLTIALRMLRDNRSIDSVKRYVAEALNPEKVPGVRSRSDVIMLKALILGKSGFKTRLAYDQRLSVDLADARQQAALTSRVNKVMGKDEAVNPGKPRWPDMLESAAPRMFDIQHAAVAATIEHRTAKDWVFQSNSVVCCDYDRLVGHLRQKGEPLAARIECTPGIEKFRWRDLATGKSGDLFGDVADAIAAYFFHVSIFPKTAPAPRIEEYRTAVLSTAHMMPRDWDLLAENAIDTATDNGLFWVHDTPCGSILRFAASADWQQELTDIGASVMLTTVIHALAGMGFHAAHFDRDADTIEGLDTCEEVDA